MENCSKKKFFSIPHFNLGQPTSGLPLDFQRTLNPTLKQTTFFFLLTGKEETEVLTFPSFHDAVSPPLAPSASIQEG